MLHVKSVREPDAGNPHVRFDERRGGNGLRVRLGERASGSGPSQWAPTNPSSTAPPAPLYSQKTGFGPENPSAAPVLRGRRLESGGLLHLEAAAIEPAAA